MEQRIAVYLRLSLEDVDLKSNRSKDESNSVGNQRLLIQNHIMQHKELEMLPKLEFCDDGYTGTNFERPQFQSMMELVKDGKISCVIVKDLSRFGRSYLEVGDYLEHIFPFLGVRFIAINDQFDSNDYIGVTSGIDVAFRNLIHQKYSEDLSYKVKSAMHTKMAKGKYINHPPFGYQKSPADKHQIVPDPQTAPIVREIFDAILEGCSTTKVAVMLNQRQVPTPMVYKKWQARKEQIDRQPIWNHRTVLRIIQDMKYTGTMVNHKCENPQIRARSQRRVPRSEWIITEGTHEGIVTKEEFQAANNFIRSVASTERKLRDGADRVFFCGHCGRKLRKSCNVNDYFACETSVYHPDAQCGNYRWNTVDLERILLESYKKQLLFLESRLMETKNRQKKEKPLDFAYKLRRVENESGALQSEKLQRYEAYRAGEISKEAFLEHKERIAERIEQLTREKTVLEKQMQVCHQTNEENEVLEDALALAARSSEISDEQLRMQMYRDIESVLIFSNEEIEIQWNLADVFMDKCKERRGENLSCAV